MVRFDLNKAQLMQSFTCCKGVQFTFVQTFDAMYAAAALAVGTPILSLVMQWQAIDWGKPVCMGYASWSSLRA